MWTTLSFMQQLLFSPCLSFPLFLPLYLPQSIASCLFSSLRDAQHSSGRSGSRLRQGEAIKTTADWNRLREQQRKLIGARVVEPGVNSNRLAFLKQRGTHEPSSWGAWAICICSGLWVSWKLSLYPSARALFSSCCCARFDFHLFGGSLIMAQLSRWANEGDNIWEISLSIHLSAWLAGFLLTVFCPLWSMWSRQKAEIYEHVNRRTCTESQGAWKIICHLDASVRSFLQAVMWEWFTCFKSITSQSQLGKKKN